MGRKRLFPRLKAQSSSARRVKQLVRHSPIWRRIPWEKFPIKDTTKGPMVWQAKAAQFYLQRDGLPTRAHWLIAAGNVENPAEVKYFVSNAPEGTPLEVLLYVGFSRWHVERCFEDEKSELGLSHFEVRNYQSLRRHLIITAVSHLFLAQVHQQWRGEKTGPDGWPDSHGSLGPDSLFVVDRPGTRKIPGTQRGNYYLDATAYRPFSTLPYTRKTPALA